MNILKVKFDQASLVAHMRKSGRYAYADLLEALSPREFVEWKADFVKQNQDAAKRMMESAK